MADFKQQSLNVLERQFLYSNTGNLAILKGEVYNKYVGDLEKTFREEILSLDECIPESLEYYWGKRFKITRTFYDNNGNLLTLSYTEFRRILKIRAFAARWDGSIDSLNDFLNTIYKDLGYAYAVDPQNMYEWFVFSFPLSEAEKYLYTNNDILPRPAGVGIDIIDNATKKYFAFTTYVSLVDYPTASPFGVYGETEEPGGFSTYED